MSKQEPIGFHIAEFEVTVLRHVWPKVKWWFSAVHLLTFLIASPNSRGFLRQRKWRHSAEGSQTVKFCLRLQLIAPDGKKRETNCTNTEALFRILLPAPSPKVDAT